ncbi:HTH CenpB-type DNA-binding domain [Sergentomyia squamirostris]
MGKEKQGAFSEEKMKQAIVAIREQKLSFQEASKLYGIPKSTIFSRMKKIKLEHGSTYLEVTLKMGMKNHMKHSKFGSQQVFTFHEEMEMEKYLITCSKLNYGLTLSETRILAYSYAVDIGHRFPESWTAPEEAGKDWAKGFVKRHRKLSLRKPENISLARMYGFNRKAITTYHHNLEEVMAQYHFDPSRIYNLDETGLSTVLPPPSIVAETGTKQVGQASSNERGNSITIVGIINAVGDYIPPIYIFPKVRESSNFMEGALEDSVGFFNKSGYMTTDLFLQTLKIIKDNANPTLVNPILLILDNHSSHLGFKGLEFCRENGIVMLTLPPHTSNKTQPLDRSVYGPFKAYCSQDINAWMKTNPGLKIKIDILARVSSNALKKSFTSKNIQAGFSKTGIYPFDFTGLFKEISEEEALNALPQESSSNSYHTSTQLHSDPVNVLTPLCDIVCVPPEPYLESPVQLTPRILLDSCESSVPQGYSSLATILDSSYNPTSPPITPAPPDAHTKPSDVQITSSDSHEIIVARENSLHMTILDSLCDAEIPTYASPEDDIVLPEFPDEQMPSTVSSDSYEVFVNRMEHPETHMIRSQKSTSPSQSLDLSTNATALHPPMIPLSLDRSVSSTFATTHRFDRLEAIRPIPRPLMFSNQSRTSRASYSKIVTGSPEMKIRYQVEKEKQQKIEIAANKRKIREEKKRLVKENKDRRRFLKENKDMMQQLSGGKKLNKKEPMDNEKKLSKEKRHTTETMEKICAQPVQQAKNKRGRPRKYPLKDLI